MQELIQVAIFVQNYVDALSRAIDNTALLLPGFARQEIENQAKNKLSTSKDAYLSALSVKMEDYVLVMEIDKDNWLACAVEKGANAWDMTNPPNGGGHLQGKNAKTSKDGHRYVHVPMSKKVGGKGGPSARSQEIQKKINEVMKRPSFKNDNMMGTKNSFHTKMGGQMIPGVHSGGNIIQTQQINVNKDPDLSGLYRTRAFSNSEEFYQKQANKKGMPQWNLVMFRTMSDNPSAKHWMHPGIKGVNILKDTETWLWGSVQKLLEENIKKEISQLGEGI